MDLREEWRPVIGWEGFYNISSRGRVRSLDRVIVRSNGSPKTVTGRVLVPLRVPPGDYLTVALYRPGHTVRRRIHVLLAEAWHGPRPPGLEVCHNNSDKDDLRPENVRWDTRAANIRDLVNAGNHGQARKTHCKRQHEFTTENTYINPASGARVCRQCKRDNYPTDAAVRYLTDVIAPRYK